MPKANIIKTAKKTNSRAISVKPLFFTGINDANAPHKSDKKSIYAILSPWGNTRLLFQRTIQKISVFF
jgi:hypothetical protein